MIKRISIFYCLLIFPIFSSCKKKTIEPKFDYNQKANELIQQVILDDLCVCILEITNESLIKTSQNENPRFDIQKLILEKLHLRDRKELDSIEKLTNNFILDSAFTRQKSIKVIPIKSLKELAKDPNFFKTCPGGILGISKPIFNKEYKIAVLSHGYAFNCIGGGMATYRFKDGKWCKK
ncbi:hypothetical protein SAMN05660845_0581 [Flavobacterium swingsii]|uniref:Lipoprotein n=1 Tax=Flavobacterium swingsii TaxID=498292 RepID=A0A1I0W8M0_9FLAO|nr:hypothetical protein [Flavobacterium swingsii]SFA84256.1 hypothetical protein SAMN05660845_0581 [Flavobacterium swingsii]